MHEISKTIVETFKNGNKVLICGNGGSATMASHFAGELVGRFEKERAPLPAISLTDNVAVITAVANDYSFEDVFSRQLEALGRKGDLLITLSTSGTSKNIQKVQEKARKMGIEVISFPSRSEYKLTAWQDKSTAQLQEEHLMLIHKICREVEEALFP